MRPRNGFVAGADGAGDGDAPRFSVLLLYGGAGRRFGEEKGLARFHGVPLAERLLAVLDAVSDDVRISTRRPEAYARFERPLVADLRPGCGPLAGLEAGLHAARHAWLAVVAGDMPFASGALLHLLARMTGACDVVVPAHAPPEEDAAQNPEGPAARGSRRPGRSSRIEPLHALYHRRCLPAVTAALDAGGRRVVDFYSAVRVREVPPEAWMAAAPDPRVFANVNTPESLRRLEEDERRQP